MKSAFACCQRGGSLGPFSILPLDLCYMFRRTCHVAIFLNLHSSGPNVQSSTPHSQMDYCHATSQHVRPSITCGLTRYPPRPVVISVRRFPEKSRGVDRWVSSKKSWDSDEGWMVEHAGMRLSWKASSKACGAADTRPYCRRACAACWCRLPKGW
jgi:hypothetical protein